MSFPEGLTMRQEIEEAIRPARRWYEGKAEAKDVDGHLARLIVSLIEADELAYWLHDTVGTNRAREKSVDMLWDVVKACDIDAIRKAITEANEVGAEEHEREIAKYE